MIVPETAASIDFVVHLVPGDLRHALLHDAATGLTASPKRIASKWFYDERGSDLFSDITRLAEYYPTRREREILMARSAAVARRSGATTLVELGSGTSEKTRLLLDAFTATNQLRRFVALDVSEECLRSSVAAVATEYPGLAVVGVVGDFERHLMSIPSGGRRCVAFLGSTIGNLDPTERTVFYSSLAAALTPGDSLLLGTDLLKDPRRLVAAYDDASGITAEFNRNVLHVLNRELGCDFVAERFAHVARFDRQNSWMAMSLRSETDQVVRVAALNDLEVAFTAGEELHTEISTKFDRAGVQSELAATGWALSHWWTDPAGDFALSLSLRT